MEEVVRENLLCHSQRLQFVMVFLRQFFDNVYLLWQVLEVCVERNVDIGLLL